MHLSHLGEIVIEGEITKIDLSQGKWLFITLKDDYSRAEVFGVAYQLSGWRALEEGMLVHVYGNPQLYMKSGRFSVTARKIVPAGEGSLKIAFEKLKMQLEKEGLFDESRKRALPEFPQRVGLITAKNSEAYKDFIKILQDRMGGLHVYVAPVSVQGERAVTSIMNALKYFNTQMPDLDALVICRGGGSLEDLHAFNDEHVARAIFASQIPVVCGVGHEGDVTLADLVADVRASTPSNAAEILVAERQNMLQLTNQLTNRIYQAYRGELKDKQHRVRHAAVVIEHSMRDHVRQIESAIQTFYRTLSLVQSHIQSKITDVQHTERLLRSLDYRSILRRGFTITRNDAGEIVRSIRNVHSQSGLLTTVGDGTIFSRVTQSEPHKKHA